MHLLPMNGARPADSMRYPFLHRRAMVCVKVAHASRKIDKRVSSLRSGNNQTIRTEIHPAWKRQIKSDSSPNIMSTSFTSEGLMTCQAVHVLHVRTTRRVVLLLQGQ